MIIQTNFTLKTNGHNKGIARMEEIPRGALHRLHQMVVDGDIISVKFKQEGLNNRKRRKQVGSYYERYGIQEAQ